MILALATTSSLAAERQTILAVEGMYCAACPYIVRETLAGTAGVKSVAVSYEERIARVVYDDSIVTPAELATNVSNAGHLARVVGP